MIEVHHQNGQGEVELPAALQFMLCSKVQRLLGEESSQVVIFDLPLNLRMVLDVFGIKQLEPEDSFANSNLVPVLEDNTLHFRIIDECLVRASVINETVFARAFSLLIRQVDPGVSR
jgi:hypothetical protein